MNKARLEAFSDGVLAIIITIMVLEIKIPEGTDWNVLKPMAPVFLSYILSFLFVGIYWGNHHHLLHTVHKVSSRIMWANMNLLFWLSLIPFATGWMGKNHFAANTIVVYSGLLLVCGLSYSALRQAIEKYNPFSPALKVAFKNLTIKGLFSSIANGLAIPLAFVNTTACGVLFLASSAIWLIPDRNIEKALAEQPEIDQ